MDGSMASAGENVVNLGELRFSFEEQWSECDSHWSTLG